MLKTSIPRLCFVATIVLGFLFVLQGMVLSTLPYLQLDVVLNPEQIKDVELRDSIQEVLKKAYGNQGLLLAIGGLVQIVIGFIGLKRTPVPLQNHGSKQQKSSLGEDVLH